MSDTNQFPAVIAAPGLVPHSGSENEKWHSPRNLIAFAMVALFSTVELLPFWITIPAGRNGDLILQGVKTIEVIIMLVLGYFFATTVNAQKQQDTIRQQALQQPGAQPAQQLVIDPPATLEVKEAPNGQEANARPGADRTAGVPAAPGVRPGDDGPPE